MLVASLNDIKKHFPAASSLQFDAVAPFIRSAEQDAVIPYLSQAQYDALNTAYNDGAGYSGMSTAEKNLLLCVQRPIVGKAILEVIPALNLVMSGSGLLVAVPDNTVAASQVRTEDLKRMARREYFQGLEAMLRFLESNTGVYTIWTASTSFTIYTECFLRSATEFNKNYFIDESRYIFTRCRAVMLEKQQMVRRITGEALYNLLLDQLRSDSVSAANKKILPFIFSAVANLTMGESLIDLVPMFSDLGIRVATTSSSLSSAVESVPDPSIVNTLMDRATAKGQARLKELKDFLYANASDYPDFANNPAVYSTSATTDYNDLNNSTHGFGI
jgi:hypothetical protein